MNYFENEIDSTLAQQKIKNKKFSTHDLSALTSKLTSLFFSSKAKNMDPYFLENTKKKTRPRILEDSWHTGKFWEAYSHSSRRPYSRLEAWNHRRPKNATFRINRLSILDNPWKLKHINILRWTWLRPLRAARSLKQPQKTCNQIAFNYQAMSKTKLNPNTYSGKSPVTTNPVRSLISNGMPSTAWRRIPYPEEPHARLPTIQRKRTNKLWILKR